MLLATFIQENSKLLALEHIPNPITLLRQLIAHRTGLTFSQVFSNSDLTLTLAVVHQLRQDIEKLQQGIPIAYVFGEVPFLDWDFFTDSRALIPRPETEDLAQKVLTSVRKAPARILDLCCGSGILGLSLALAFPNAEVHLSDLSKPALALTEKNIQRHGLEQRTACFQGDLWHAIPAGTRYDLIVANPPYVGEGEPVMDSVLTYEPSLALFSEDKGRAHILAILKELDTYLNPEGMAAFELGHHHSKTLPPAINESSFKRSFHWVKDPFGVARFLFYDGATFDA